MNVKTVLQVRIRPGSFDVGPETIGLKQKRTKEEYDNYDLPIFLDEVEWFTKDVDSVVVTAILVKVEKLTDTYIEDTDVGYFAPASSHTAAATSYSELL